MGEQDHALHEISDARARMSEIADELALHAQPERVKELASEKVSEWKERAKVMAKEKAGELKDQAKEAVAEKVSDMKTHAKEAVMHKTMELKEQADTPRGWSLLGAIIGAGVGAVLMKKAFTAREERHDWKHEGSEDFRYRGENYSAYGYGRAQSYNSPAVGVSAGTNAGTNIGSDSGAGLKERASDAAHAVTDKASELKDKAWGAVEQVRDRASHLRERIPSGSELKFRSSDWFNRALENQPVMLALGGMALGVFASMLIPVSNRERQLIEPAKAKVQEGISQLGDQLEQKLQGSNTGFQDSNTGFQGSNTGFQGTSSTGAMGSSESLMGAERPGFTGTQGGFDGSQDRSESLTSPTGSRIPPTPPLDDLSKIH
jgi:ElaB/YqjD/DUF883 family membrane-anchored ribosome-binding protein